MSPRGGFDRFMVDLEIGRNLKIGRLTLAERWVFIAGVLPIAAKARVRGVLLIGNIPAEALDIARQADAPVKVAQSALQKLRTLEVLEFDAVVGAECVHDFEDWNPAPRRDITAADRQRRKRDKDKRHAAVTDMSRRDSRDITPPEVEEEVEEQQSGLTSNVVGLRDGKTVDQGEVA